MAKFAKIIDVKDVKDAGGIEQILLFVHQNENGLYAVSSITQFEACELKFTTNFQPADDSDNCKEAAMELFDGLSNIPDQVTIECITSSAVYKAVVGYRND